MNDLWRGDLPGDLRGYVLSAPEGRVGVVAGEASGGGWRCLVVAAAQGRRIAVPAGVVRRVDRRARILHVAASSAYLLDGPALDEDDDPAAEAVRTEVGAYFASVLEGSAPVLPAH